MIKQLQMGIRLLRYSYRIELNLMGGIAILLIGIVMESCSFYSGGAYVPQPSMGGYFLLMMALWPLQMLISLNVPGIVASSPWKKRIQTTVFSTLAVFFFLLTYTLILVLRLVKWQKGYIGEEQFVLEMLEMAGFVLLLMIYITTSLKYFVVSTIVFCIIMPAFMVSYITVSYTGMITAVHFSPLAVVLFGYAMIFLSALLGNGILHLLYKKPVSKYSQMSGLRKKM